MLFISAVCMFYTTTTTIVLLTTLLKIKKAFVFCLDISTRHYRL
jgi:hypothetical protein